jgi:hypothetical protein
MLRSQLNHIDKEMSPVNERNLIDSAKQLIGQVMNDRKLSLSEIPPKSPD